MTDNEVAELSEHIEELDDDRGFTELNATRIKNIATKAALFVIDGDEHWIPFSQLRYLDGEVYAAEWLLKKNGIC